MRKILLLLISSSLYSQVGIGTIAPNQDAMLEVMSSSKGILLPRISLTQTNLPDPMLNHSKGMVVYNTALNGTGTTTVYPGLYYNNGIKWIRFTPNTVKIGEFKHSLATSDHNGWYLLDGRVISSLPSNAQSNAALLGFTTNLIDGANKFLKGKTGSETLGSSTGSSTFNITQNNLPNINFTGSTNTAGTHLHNVDSFIGMENIGLLSTSVLTLFTIESVAKETSTTTNKTTQISGNHTHSVTFNSGGTNTPVDRTPKYMATNLFIYLGN